MLRSESEALLEENKRSQSAYLNHRGAVFSLETEADC